MWFGRKKKRRKKPAGRAISAVATGGSIRVVPANFQHMGARENQEDAFAFSDLSDKKAVREKGILAVVADGMGGLARGEEASSLAVSTFLHEYEAGENDGDIGASLNRALRIANAAVYDLSFTGAEEDDDLGTTLVAVVIYRNELHWISVGDSRIYLFRDEQLQQLTKDHIYANHLLNDVINGRISLQEAENHPERSHLTSYLGLPELTEISQSEEPLPLEPGDGILLCSDGLYDTLSETCIEDLLKGGGDGIAEKMVGEVLSKGSRHQDNVTVIVLSII